MSTPSQTTCGFTCECEERMRSSCVGEDFYEESDGKRYCVLHHPSQEKKEQFEKALERKLNNQDLDFQGVWFPDQVAFSGVFNGKVDFTGARFSNYTTFFDVDFNGDVYFRLAQFGMAANFAHAKFRKNAYFGGARFENSCSFLSAEFVETAEFKYTEFKHVNFELVRFTGHANFDSAQFSEAADFRDATFGQVGFFCNAQFHLNADFRHARFNWSTDFSDAVFRANAYFQWASFKEKPDSDAGARSNTDAATSGDVSGAAGETAEVSFAGARFKDGVTFEMNDFGEEVRLSFAAAIFEKIERVTFHTVRLRPHWFVNVDPRKFNFINVDWGFLDRPKAVHKEIKSLENQRIGPTRLLEVTFRQLAVNAEENNRYEEAANFRYMAMEIKRLNRWRKIDWLRLSWWYWLLSGYGERVQRAVGVLTLIWVLFAIIYWSGNATWWEPQQIEIDKIALVSKSREEQPSALAKPLTFSEALIYSIGVMALQKPRPLPANKRAKAFVLIETVLGPLQAALLALAIRRKFMR